MYAIATLALALAANTLALPTTTRTASVVRPNIDPTSGLSTQNYATVDYLNGSLDFTMGDVGQGQIGKCEHVGVPGTPLPPVLPCEPRTFQLLFTKLNGTAGFEFHLSHTVTNATGAVLVKTIADKFTYPTNGSLTGFDAESTAKYQAHSLNASIVSAPDGWVGDAEDGAHALPSGIPGGEGAYLYPGVTGVAGGYREDVPDGY